MISIGLDFVSVNCYYTGMNVQMLEMLLRQFNNARETVEKESLAQQIDALMKEFEKVGDASSADYQVMRIFFERWLVKRSKTQNQKITKTGIGSNQDLRTLKNDQELSVVDFHEVILDEKKEVLGILKNIGLLQQKESEMHEDQLMKLTKTNEVLLNTVDIQREANAELKTAYEIESKGVGRKVTLGFTGTGAALGTLGLPGIGTVVGGAVGWVIGKVIGSKIKSKTKKQLNSLEEDKK